MEENLTIAEIQQAFFEYRANFKELVADFGFGGRQGEIIKALHKALSPWKVGLENVTWNQAAKNVAEVQLTFGVLSLFASIQVGVAGVTMTAFNPDWSRAPLLISMFQAGLEALKESTAQNLESQLVTLGFHVKPREARPFKEILSEFVNAKALGGEDATMYGVSVYTNDYSFVIDGSGVIPGGVFIKLIRNFAGEKRLEDIATTLYKDEETVLHRLGLRLQ